MEEDKAKNQQQSQGKKATAETNMTYNQDAEALKNSATTSMADFDSGGSIAVGGGRIEDMRKNNAGESEKDGPKP
ncbi:MAG: hypothetical protein ACO1OF_06630 [Adhaeribacter sp.]